MAIYHLNVQIIGRSSGRSAVAAAAYRSGENIYDERTGLAHDYTRRRDEIESEIIAPKDAPEWVYDRAHLWNKVEEVEKRKDSQLAREINVALPVELPKDEHKRLLYNYIKENFTSQGMVADVSIHYKGDNPHAHIMLTTRNLTNEGFGSKNRDWNPDFSFNKKDKVQYLNNSEKCVDWRASWADHINKALERANISERVDHKSLKDQGIERVAQIHLGPHVNAMEKKGIQTDRGDMLREIGKQNNRLEEMKREKVVALDEYKAIKAEQQQKQDDIWKDFMPNEKTAVLQAKDILGKYVNMTTISKGYKELEAQEREFDKKLYELSEKEHPYLCAKNTLEALNKCREEFKQIGIFDLKNRTRRESLKEIIKSHERTFKNYGLGSEEGFMSTFGKVKQGIEQQKEEIIQEKFTLAKNRDTLKNAELALKTVEYRKLMQMYPGNEKYLKNMNFGEVKAINDLNKIMGNRVSFKDMHDMGSKARHIKEENIRLSKAQRYIEKYESLKEQLEKLENSMGGQLKRAFNKKAEEEYQDLKRDLKSVEIQLSSCKVNSREDLMQQKEVLKQDAAELPTPIKSMGMSNGLDILDNVLKAVVKVSQEISRVKNEEKWEQQRQQKQLERQNSPNRSKFKDMDRER